MEADTTQALPTEAAAQPPAEAAVEPTGDAAAEPPAVDSAASTSEAVTPNIDVTARYVPARWLLLSCYEATHGEGCMLSKLSSGGAISSTRREGVALALFARLTGAKVLLPPMSRAAEIAKSLFDESVVIYRRVGQHGQLPPQEHMDDERLRRWLLGRPDSLAPTKTAFFPHNYVHRDAQHGHLSVKARACLRERPKPIGQVSAFGHSATRTWLSQKEVGTLRMYDLDEYRRRDPRLDFVDPRPHKP